MTQKRGNGAALAGLLGIVGLYMAPYGLACIFHWSHPGSVGFLMAHRHGNQVVLIGESRMPRNWFRDHLGPKPVEWINRLFFELPGSFDVKVNKRRVHL
jgi:hypothetical protein